MAAPWLAIAGPMAMQGGGMLLNHNAQKEANEISKENAAKNIAHQKEFAQHGIRWKVEDAKLAGLSPLAALGAQTTSFSPVHVGDQANTAIGDGLQNMGQDLSRSINATRTQEERTLAQLNLQGAKLDLEGKALENQIRASQLQKMNSVGPALPSATDNGLIPGQGNTVKINPAEHTASGRSGPNTEAGAINELGYYRTKGGYGVVPSKDMKERIEDDFIGELMWHLKNRINPTPPNEQEYPLSPEQKAKGYKHWFWNPFMQKFVPSKNP